LVYLRLYPGSLREEFVYQVGAMKQIVDAESMINQSSAEMNESRSLTPWWQAILGGLPHLLYALSIYIASLVRVLYLDSLNLYWLNSVFWIAVTVTLLFAWQRRWPCWSASWVGYGLVMVFNILIDIAQTYYGSLLENEVVVFWLVLTAVVFFWLARRDWLSGLLVVLPVVPMFLTYISLDGVKGTIPEALVFIAAGLLMMFVVVIIIRKNDIRLGVLLIVFALVTINLPVSYLTTYQSNVPPEFAVVPTISNMVKGFLLGNLIFVIFATPLWAIVLWTKGQQWYHQTFAREKLN
jgi:hypothetical protein